MPPKIPPSASPTELLWAHQMRREHGLLLQRMQKLEAAISSIESSASSRSQSHIAAIQEQVKTLSRNSDVDNAIKHVRDDLTGQVGQVTANVDRISNKLSEMDRRHRGELAVKEEQAKKDAELLQKAESLEAAIKQSRESIESLHTRVTDGQIDKVQEQFAGLAREIQDGSDDLQTVRKAVELLAVKCKELENVDQQTTKSINGVGLQLEEIKTRNSRLDQGLENVKQKLQEAVKSTFAVNASPSLVAPLQTTRDDQTAVSDVANTTPAAMEAASLRPGPIRQIKAQAIRGGRKAMLAASARTAAAKGGPTVSNSRQKKDDRGNTATSLRRLSRRRIDSATKKPVVKSGKGYVVIEEKVEDVEEVEELADFLSKINTGRPTARGRAPMQDNSAQGASGLQRRHSSRSRTPAMVRTASVVHSIEVPNVSIPRPKRRSIEQTPMVQARTSKTSNDGLVARFATQKSRRPQDTIEVSIDVHAPRTTRSQKAQRPAAPAQPALKAEGKSPKKRVAIKKEPKTSPQKRTVAAHPVTGSQRPLKKRRTIPQD